MRASDLPEALDQQLEMAQHACFRLGAVLASVPGKDPGVPAVSGDDVDVLEQAIDVHEEALPALKTFILPGGGEASARLHLARTVCRRAERGLVALGEHEAVEASAVRWLNRLSDLLFVMARRANHEAGIADVPWVGREQSP